METNLKVKTKDDFSSKVKRYWYDLESRVYDMNFGPGEAELVLKLFKIRQHEISFVNGKFQYKKEVFLEDIYYKNGMYYVRLNERVEKKYGNKKSNVNQSKRLYKYSNFKAVIDSLHNGEVVECPSNFEALEIVNQYMQQK